MSQPMEISVANGAVFEIRQMTENDTNEVFELIDKENWAATFSKIQKSALEFMNDHLVVEKKDDGQVIATVRFIPTQPGQRLLGYFVVREDWRNQGIGSAVLQFIVNKFQDETLTLVATPPSVRFYRSNGFIHDIEPDHLVLRILVNRDKIRTFCDSKDYSTENIISIVLFSTDLQDELNEYDSDARGYDCVRFLSVMTQTSEKLLIAKNNETGRIVGYTSGVVAGDLLWIDGMYANSDAIALRLMREFLDYYPDKSEVKIETVKTREFLAQFGEIQPSSSMYIRKATKLPAKKVELSKLYAVSDCGHTE